MLFKFLISCLIVMIGWYYLIVIAQLLGIIEVTGLTKDNQAFDKKNLIPFYQFFKLFYNYVNKFLRNI